MRTRRTALAAAGSVLAAGTAGCLGVILGEDLEFEASPGSVSDLAQEDTGYEQHEVTDIVVERTVEAGGESRDVVVTNWQAKYDKAVELADVPAVEGQRARAAVFSVLSSPQVDVLGREFNPIADMDPAEIADQVQDRYDGMDDLQEVGSESVTLLGESTTATGFEGSAELLDVGVDVEMLLWITESVESGDDHVLVLGGYPTLLEAEERSNVFRLIEGTEH